MRIRLGLFLTAIIFSAALVGGAFGEEVAAPPPVEDRTQQLLKSFTEALATVEQNYAQEVPTQELVESAIRGMLRTLDPHSSFFTRRDYDRLQEEQQGKYFGLGITIRAESPGSGRVVVIEPPAHGTPAYKAGLRAGDVIARVEGEPIDDWDVNEQVIPSLKGPKGTTVNITVERLGESEPLELTVGRDEIPIYTIKFAFRVEPGIGYIRIDRFAESTGRELDEALKSIGEEDLEGLVLDLRNNPGGALSQALAVSGRFLERGQTIVSTRNRYGRERPYTVQEGGSTDYPMVVLINRSSASASEIVSGALQDHDRALIVGENSFGKALVQTIYPLDGNRGLALTTGRYYTPSDRLIQRRYADSFWDYYYSNDEEQAAAEPEDGERYETDSGRAVYGGGGINPDEVVKLERLSRLIGRMQRKDVFRSFAARLYSGEITTDGQYSRHAPEVESMGADERRAFADDLQITEATLDRFAEYVKAAKLAVSREAFDGERTVLANLLRQELLLLYFGEDESFRVALELDTQVQRGIELIPQARMLLEDPVLVQTRRQ